MDIEDWVAASIAYLASGTAMEALAMSPYRQVELEQSRAALPVSEAVPTPADDPAAPAIAAQTAAKPESRTEKDS